MNKEQIKRIQSVDLCERCGAKNCYSSENMINLMRGVVTARLCLLCRRDLDLDEEAGALAEKYAVIEARLSAAMFGEGDISTTHGEATNRNEVIMKMRLFCVKWLAEDPMRKEISDAE